MLKGHLDKVTLLLIAVCVLFILAGLGLHKYREKYDNTWMAPYKTKIAELESENDSLRYELQVRESAYAKAAMHSFNCAHWSEMAEQQIDALESALRGEMDSAVKEDPGD
jgi:hypothetical protein